MAALLFAQRRQFFGIEEIRVRIERPQHARNRALVDGFVGRDLVGIILVDEVVNLSERFDARLQVFVEVGLAFCCAAWGAADTELSTRAEKPPTSAQAAKKRYEKKISPLGRQKNLQRFAAFSIDVIFFLGRRFEIFKSLRAGDIHLDGLRFG